MTAQTPMLIGSLSKSFTALGVLQLAEAGWIDLDAPVQSYLPWFRVGPAPSGCGKSTLARVLTGLIPQVIPTKISRSVEVAGLDAIHCPTAELAQQVGVIFQNPRAHLFHLRVADEVAFCPSNLAAQENMPNSTHAEVDHAAP
jgi:ABC-type polar amino acid transport system ATPase subunit